MRCIVPLLTRTLNGCRQRGNDVVTLKLLSLCIQRNAMNPGSLTEKNCLSIFTVKYSQEQRFPIRLNGINEPCQSQPRHPYSITHDPPSLFYRLVDIPLLSLSLSLSSLRKYRNGLNAQSRREERRRTRRDGRKKRRLGKKKEEENDEWMQRKRKKEHFTSLSNGTQRDELCSTDLGQ